MPAYLRQRQPAQAHKSRYNRRVPATEIIARIAIFRGQWLLACRNPAAGYYYLPGGHVEFGESAAAAT